MLYAEQRLMLRDYFAGTTETLILVSKKNGKTTLMAALAIYHLVTTPDAECVIAAASRDQAAIMLRQARGFIRRSEGLQQRIKPNQREIVSLADEGRIRVLAADADTADGVLPTLALVDELHRHKSADLYGVFRDGLGPRDGKLITISTAGDAEDSPLGLMRREAYEKTPRVVRAGAYRYARANGGDYVLHEWALESADDVHDMTVVKSANPAPWQTIKALGRRHDSPSMTPWQWARFACGIWIESETPWISPDEWDACTGDPSLPDGAQCYLGVDIGQVHDSSAVVTAAVIDGKLRVQAKIWTPTPGRPIDIATVERHILDMAGQHRIMEVAFDPDRFSRSRELLEERGIVMVEFPQTNTRMSPASNLLYDLVRAGNLVHDGDPLLRSHALAGVARETESGWRISKQKSRKKIDALIALALAASRAYANEGRTLPRFEVLA